MSKSSFYIKPLYQVQKEMQQPTNFVGEDHEAMALIYLRECEKKNIKPEGYELVLDDPGFSMMLRMFNQHCRQCGIEMTQLAKIASVILTDTPAKCLLMAHAIYHGIREFNIEGEITVEGLSKIFNNVLPTDEVFDEAWEAQKIPSGFIMEGDNGLHWNPIFIATAEKPFTE